MLTLLLILLGCGHPFIAEELTPEGCIIPDVVFRDPDLRGMENEGPWCVRMIYEETGGCYYVCVPPELPGFRPPTTEEEAWCNRDIGGRAPECPAGTIPSQ